MPNHVDERLESLADESLRLEREALELARERLMAAESKILAGAAKSRLAIIPVWVLVLGAMLLFVFAAMASYRIGFRAGLAEGARDSLSRMSAEFDGSVDSALPQLHTNVTSVVIR